MFKIFIAVSALSLGVATSALAQDSHREYRHNMTMQSETENGNDSGSAVNEGALDHHTTGSITLFGNHATGGGADGGAGTCNAIETGKNTGNGTMDPALGETTNC